LVNYWDHTEKHSQQNIKTAAAAATTEMFQTLYFVRLCIFDIRTA